MDGTITTPATAPAPLPAEAALPRPPSVLRRVAGHPGLVAGTPAASTVHEFLDPRASAAGHTDADRVGKKDLGRLHRL